MKAESYRRRNVSGAHDAGEGLFLVHLWNLWSCLGGRVQFCSLRLEDELKRCVRRVVFMDAWDGEWMQSKSLNLGAVPCLSLVT